MSDTAGITLSVADEPRRNALTQVARPQLILALECNRPAALSARYDLGRVRGVNFGRGSARTVRRHSSPGLGPETRNEELDVRVPDRWMSSRHARLESSFGRWVLTDTQSKNGVFVNGAPVQRGILQDGDLIELGHTIFLFRAALPMASGHNADVDLEADAPAIQGMCTLVPGFAHQLAQLARVATASIPVLVQGESGTGKEVIARATHELSGRPGALVAVNCGAIPANLVESELFGHKRGSFSGAIDDHPGLVRSAHKGTLFLDEIGDLPAPSQAALLRVLQEREVMPVGGTKPVPVDLRVIAATHQDLDHLIDTGGFRQDLFARLAGFQLRLPCLRERMEDLGMLIGVLFRKIVGQDEHPGFDCDAVRALFGYSWPLNIRELEQTLATAIVLAGDATIRVDHLPARVVAGEVRAPGPGPAPASASASAPAPGHEQRSVHDAGRLDPEDEDQRRRLFACLSEHRGNVSAIARAMGKDRKQIQRWLKRYGFKASDFRR